ncbi:MAG: glycosyltransferase family 4 protein [Oligoflexia bacterium]|nr:glycosyltransferase family 4 protein [Oligoflexia bacterium]
MANILVLGVKVPFTWGGQDVLVATLIKELKARGHLADVVELPFQVPPKENLLLQSALWRALDLTSFGGRDVDLVIATKYPSFYARHPRKSLWLVHQHRPIYDLLAGQYSDFSDNPRDEAMRRMIFTGDTKVIGECRYISGISKNVCERLKAYNGLDAEVLYPPLPLGRRYRSGPAQDYILSVGRICGIKRVDMLIKALPIVHQSIKLKIVGTPDEPDIMDYLQNEIAKHHLGERVEFLGRVSEQELIELYAGALAVYYAPHNEDFGYVTLEALASGKAVVTAADSGGVLEFVKDGQTGLVVEPNIDAIGHAFRELAEDRDRAAKLGADGRAFIEQSGFLDGGWDQVIGGLLSPLTASDKLNAVNAR